MHVSAICTPSKPTFYIVTVQLGYARVFLFFDPKHRLWVLVRTAEAVLMCTHNQCFEQR